MNILNGFINKGTDSRIIEFLFKSNLVPKQVIVNGKNGQYVSTRMVNPDSSNSKSSDGKFDGEKPKTSLRQKFKNALLGKTTKLGTEITSFDNAHFFRRVNGRHAKVKDVSDALFNPQYTRKGSNQKGSTEYWGNKVIVVVVDSGTPKGGKGQIKTVYPVNKSRLNNKLKELKEATV